jgi:hypothetical protein
MRRGTRARAGLVTCLESDGGAVDVELGCVEDEEAGGRGHRDGDGRGAGEVAGGEVGADAEVVAERGGEAREARLAPELRRRVRHSQRRRGYVGGFCRRRRGERGMSGAVVWWRRGPRCQFCRAEASWVSSGPGLEYSAGRAGLDLGPELRPPTAGPIV